MSSIIISFNRNNCNIIKTQLFPLNHDNHRMLTRKIILKSHVETRLKCKIYLNKIQVMTNNMLARTISFVSISSFGLFNPIIL